MYGPTVWNECLLRRWISIQRGTWQHKSFEYGTWGGEFRAEFVPAPGEIVTQEHWCSSGFPLARKLSDEGLNFTEILQQLRRDLAVRYLGDRKLHVSKIAWVLGFHEVSAFTHAFKRWTGKTPRQMRAASAY